MEIGHKANKSFFDPLPGVGVCKEGIELKLEANLFNLSLKVGSTSMKSTKDGPFKYNFERYKAKVGLMPVK